MAQLNASVKHLQIDKANVTMVTIIAVACFLTVFYLVASRAIWQQMSYQSKVISQKTTARNTLVSNLKARDQLVSQYNAFENTTTNVIGGSPTGTGDKDGDNAKIILDALPSKYDFPAVATSLEKLLTSNSLTIDSISGSDDEIAQSGSTATTPQPVPMPFQMSFSGNTDQTSALFAALQNSIRPIQVQTVTISGSDAKVTTTLTAQTYYQPEKNLNIKSEVVPR
jgi:hypothetical protein